MAKGKGKRRARQPNNPRHVVTLNLPRVHMAVLWQLAELAGVSVDAVCSVILAQGILVERLRMTNQSHAPK